MNASGECLVRTTLAALAAGILSGCPRAAKSPVPPDRPIVITPAIAPRPWWRDGAHACPSLEVATPGGITVHTGRVRVIDYFASRDACRDERLRRLRLAAESPPDARGAAFDALRTCAAPDHPGDQGAPSEERAWTLFRAAVAAVARDGNCALVEAFAPRIHTLAPDRERDTFVKVVEYGSCIEAASEREAAAEFERAARARAWREDPRAACREERRRADELSRVLADPNERARILTRVPDCGGRALPVQPAELDAPRIARPDEPPEAVPTTAVIRCEAGGIAHGPASRLYPDHRPASTGTFDHGRLHGSWTTWNPNGTVSSHGQYQDGGRVGVWTTYFASGRPAERGAWRGDTKVGMWLDWDDEGDARRRPDRFVDHGTDGESHLEGHFRGGTPRESRILCIVGFAYPACRFITLLELGWRWTDAGRSGWSEVGGIVNLGERHGVGLTAGGSDNDSAVGVRYRLWLLENVAAESGIARIDTPDGAGWRVHLSLVLGDALTVFVAADRTTIDGAHEVRGVAGVKFGLAALVLAAAGVAGVFSVK